MLEGGNIKLSGTISNILGMSGRRLLDGLLAGRKFTKEDIEEMFEDENSKHRPSNLPETAMESFLKGRLQ